LISLRPYQSISVFDLIPNSFRKGHKRIIRCAPTGSGKSLEMAEMTRLAYEKGKRVVLLTHRKELFKSTLAHLGNAGIPCAELDAGSSMPIGDWRVMLCMEKTLWNRIHKSKIDSTGQEKFYNGVNYNGYDLTDHNPPILMPDLIICDEGHFNNFTKIIEHFSSSFVITFTATPQGKHISKLYTDIVQNIGIPELLQQGYLTPCKPYMMKDADGFDKVKKKGDDFDTNELFKIYNKANRYKGVLDEYFKLVKGLKGIVFCVNVEHTIKTYEAFMKDGVNTFLCHSKMTESERDYNIREYESSEDGVMINCGILTTGYSHDPIMFVFVDRATTSLPLWLQMQGRGSRKHTGKSHFIVCDFGDNHTRLGLWNQPRTWSLEPPKKRKTQQAAPVKTCPNCSAMLFASVRICEFCGHTFEIATTELREGVMCEVDTGTPIALKGKRVSELSLEEIADIQKSKRYKSTYCWRIVRSKGIDAITEYAKLFGYKNGWVFSQIQKIQDSKFSNYIIK